MIKPFPLQHALVREVRLKEGHILQNIFERNFFLIIKLQVKTELFGKENKGDIKEKEIN